jgi:DNA mismatch repair protein MutS
MTIIQDYLKLTKELINNYGEKSLVLMQVGSFFECYALLEKDGSYSGSLIKEFAEINDMTISRKNMCVGHQNVMMAGFGLPQLEKYIKKLQDNGFTIAVYTQDSPSKNTTRSLQCIYSPGTYFSQDSQEISNNTTCIWIHHSAKNNIMNEQITIGISNIDIYTGKTNIFEFSNEFQQTPGTYDYLEKFISVYNPKECIIISNLNEDNINSIINFINLNSIQIHKILLEDSLKNNDLIKEAKNCEQQKYQSEIYKKFFKNSENIIDEYYYSCIASQSFCFLLNFVSKHNPYLVEKIDKPIREECSDKLILANHSLKQLNIISDNRYIGKLGSVQEFLNNCVTIMGKREFNQTLLNPITNIDKLNRSYNLTEYVIKENKWENMRIVLNNMRDIEKIKRKMIMNKISPKDITILSNNIQILKNLYKEIKKDKFLLENINNRIKGNFEEQCKIYESFLKKHFILNKMSNIDDITPERLNNFSIENLSFINKLINNELDNKIKNCMDSKEKLETIRAYFENIIKDFEKSTKVNKNHELIKIHETPKSDPMLLGTKRRISLLKNHLDKLKDTNIILKYTSKYNNEEEEFKLNIESLDYKPHGGNASNSIIISPEINKLTHTIQNARDLLINVIITVFKDIINEFRKLLINKENNDEFLFIDNLINLTKECDMIQCKAFLAIKNNYCKPQIIESEESFVEVEKIRHCLIEQLNSQEVYVSNDFDLGLTQKGILLYGTNAVGKTSIIKSIGISIIMAQSGFFVPCESFRYSPYKYLFTRILGNDNIFKGLSTFAVEMSELRTILKFAQKNSLILGDELCSGTESSSALSIFTAGLEKLHEIGCSFIFATHFHEIVKYEEIQNLENLKLYHMTVFYDASLKKLIYDRKLRLGPGDNMYGLEVCKSLDLPIEFLDRAHSLRNKYQNELSILEQKTSKYNGDKIKGMCEICKINMGTEVHHLQHRKNAKSGIINKEFKVNHKANLINICERCHDKIHKSNKEHKISKTNEGYEIIEI